jgi:hypothetical protein
MTGFTSKRKVTLDKLDDDDIQVYAQPEQLDHIVDANKMAQPAQEPDDLTIAYMIGLYDGKKKRPWAGLTDKQIRKWWASENGLEDCEMTKLDDFVRVVRAVEAKLKE